MGVRMRGGQGDDYLGDVEAAIDGRLSFDSGSRGKKKGGGDTFLHDIRDILFGRNKKDPVNGMTDDSPSKAQSSADIVTPGPMLDENGLIQPELVPGKTMADVTRNQRPIPAPDVGVDFPTPPNKTTGDSKTTDDIISGGKKLGFLDKVAHTLGSIF